MDAEKKFYPFHEEATAEDIVVHCSDPRFQEAFRLFIQTELGIANCAPIVIPGSVSAVSLNLVMPKRLKALREQIEFVAGLGKDPRIVVINHEDCRMYAQLGEFFRRVVSAQQVDDLASAAKFFSKWVPSLRAPKVELYMARIGVNGDGSGEKKVYFERIKV